MNGLWCMSNGGITTCQNDLDGGPVISFPTPAGWPAFFDYDTIDPLTSSYHHYDESVADSSECSNLMQAIVNNPTPGPNNSPATSQGTPNNATPSELSAFGESPVLSYYTKDSNGNPVVINVTEPGHPLFPGYVVRTIDANGVVHNYGEGMGRLQSALSPFGGYISGKWQAQTKGLMNSCGCGQ